jgi:hypothetical protein
MPTPTASPSARKPDGRTREHPGRDPGRGDSRGAGPARRAVASSPQPGRRRRSAHAESRGGAPGAASENSYARRSCREGLGRRPLRPRLALPFVRAGAKARSPAHAVTRASFTTPRTPPERNCRRDTRHHPQRGAPMTVTKTACSIEDCAKPAHGRGYCNAHYQRWRNQGDPLTLGRPGRPRDGTRGVLPCSVPGCEALQFSRGYCELHYARLLRPGMATARPQLGLGLPLSLHVWQLDPCPERRSQVRQYEVVRVSEAPDPTVARQYPSRFPGRIERPRMACQHPPMHPPSRERTEAHTASTQTGGWGPPSVCASLAPAWSSEISPRHALRRDCSSS